jgi:5'-nucleotidase / UDP-sugar diphosphatase
MNGTFFRHPLMRMDLGQKGGIMMRKAGRAIAVLALVLGLTVLGSAQTKTLTILHTNDTHSAMLPMSHPSVPGPFAWLFAHNGPGSRARAALARETGGIARMAALIRQVRMHEKNVLALNAGDVFVGSFEFNKYLGYPELKIMEQLYDAMELGNHEFDLGTDVLTGVVTGAIAQGDPVNLPLLNANFNLSGVPYLSQIVQKSITRTIDGVKIGIFGLLNEDAENYSEAVIPLFSGNVEGVAAAQVQDLKAKGCQVIICLSHLGTSADMTLADDVAGIDIIVGGHSHDLFDSAVLRNGKIIVQAGSHGQYLGQLKVELKAGGGVSFLDWDVRPVDSWVKPDLRVQAQMNRLRDGIVQDPRFGPVYSQIVALVGRDIAHDPPAVGPFRDAPLADLVTDAMMAAVKNAGIEADCALDALGYTEFGIPAGRIVGNDVMRAVPYGYDPESGLGFKLVVVPMYGALILGGLDYAVSSGSASMSIQVSGMTYAFHSGVGHVVPESVMVGGEPVALNLYKVYNVVMTEGIYRFLAALAASQGFDLSPVATGILEYNAVRDYMRSLHVVDYRSEGRVIDLAATAAAIKRR